MSTASAPELSADWRDLFTAIGFARDRFANWAKDGTARTDLATYYSDLLTKLNADAASGQPLPSDPYLPPLEGPDPKFGVLRCWKFVANEIRRREDAGHLTANAAHACLNDVHGRMKYLRRRLDAEPPMVHPAPDERVVIATPRKPIMELLLDPRSIQWLLAAGGGLFVLGAVLYLYSKGVFENKLFVACGLGAANTAALVSGWAIVRRTRYQMAGRALTLLACLVMPLNLWFYHAQGLVTLDGHLWVAGVVVSALYAATAWVVRERTFVSVFVAGVAMTGLLLLADLNRFWEIAAPSTFLVVFGLAAIHVERAFPEGDGPFTRKSFGRGFFEDGHASLAVGLLLLLGAQLAGHWFYPFFQDTYRSLQALPSPVVTEPWGQWLALGLVVAGIYAYLYSDLVVRRSGFFAAAAAGCCVWAEILALELLKLPAGTEIVLMALAGTSLAVNAIAATRRPVARSLPTLGLVLALVPLALGLVLHYRSTNLALPSWRYSGGWPFVGAMALTVVACRFGAQVSREEGRRRMSIYFFATAAAEMVGAAALLRQLGYATWDQQAWLLMLIPIAHVIAARLYAGKPWASPVFAAGQAATFVMLASSVVATLGSVLDFQHGSLNLTLAGFFAEAALFFALTAVLHGRASGVYWAAVTGCAAVWQGLLYFGVPDELYAAAFAALGMILLIAYRLASTDGVGRFTGSRAGFDSANGLLTVAFVAATLIGLRTLLSDSASWRSVGICTLHAIAALVAAAVVHHDGWRRGYLVAAVAQSLLALVTLQALSMLSMWQKAELFATAAGLLLLVAGHVGWYRERDSESDGVSTLLGFGSVLVMVPLTAGLLWYRSTPAFSWPEELGVLTLGLGLLVSGSMLRIKSTTLAGVSMVTAFVVTLPLYARGMLKELQTTAILMTIGGGLVFGIGLALAMFRDRLLTLPDRIRKREGVFAVLGWR
ncbi:MAG: hypothetical protein U0746_04690 [Gemmataceae bacterium]